MTYRCQICETEFDSIPRGAVELYSRGQSHVFRFADGIVHDLRRLGSHTAHARWHKTNPRPGCELCFPPVPEILSELQPEIPPTVVEQTEPVAVPVAAEVELVSMTAMEAAFRRLK